MNDIMDIGLPIIAVVYIGITIIAILNYYGVV